CSTCRAARLSCLPGHGPSRPFAVGGSSMKRWGALLLAAAVGGCTSTNPGPQVHTDTTVRASGQYLAPGVPGAAGPYGEPVQPVAPYAMSRSMTARQAAYAMSQSVPLDYVVPNPGVVQAGAQMPGLPQMPTPPGGMLSPPGLPSMPGMPPGMMPPGMMP